MAIREEDILQALRAVEDPDLHRDIVTLGFVKNVRIVGGSVEFDVELTTPACPVKDQLQQQAHDVVAALDGVEEVHVTMTAQVRSRGAQAEDLIPRVKQIIAIASGKGGVGKSTVTVNLAVALANQGATVGILDADVYGPSIPMMMGVADAQPLTKDAKLIPVYQHGVSLMSIGFLLQEGQAVLWRGPMVAGTVKQLLADVAWGDLDYLLVDLPPGTGDAPMSLAQLVPLTGVVIVTTPQSVATNIAGKAAALFRRLNTPILGVVENMAGFVCGSCGEVTRVFSGMTGEALSESLSAPYLGSIPLDPAVGNACEKGQPSLLSNPDSPQAKAFVQVSSALAQQVSLRQIAKSEAALLS